jgi:hypothetical protein
MMPMHSNIRTVVKPPKVERLEPGTSLINTFSIPGIQRHIDGLARGSNPHNTPARLKPRLMPIIRKMLEHKCAYIFSKPVDPVSLSIPDYFTIITDPMDLGTVRRRLEGAYYKDPEKFAQDVRLTLANALRYNDETSFVHGVAKELGTEFENMFAKTMAEMEEEEEKRRAGDNACALCGGEKFTFEPLVIYCNGTCGNRIRRNANYFSCNKNKYHWCTSCQSDIKTEEIIMGEVQLRKSELIKKKNNEKYEESWVECETCQRWVHQICALFNGRSNKSDIQYHCPMCVMKRRSAGDPNFVQLSAAAGAKELKKNVLSNKIEESIDKLLRQLRVDEAARRGVPQSEIETASGLRVRILSNVEKSVPVRERLYERYKNRGYPDQFTFKSKAIFLFQEVDGVEVVILGLYVHECGVDTPDPNNRRVYVSYLDTVKYLRPPVLRTHIYHEILSCYLKHCKSLGYHTAYIWACPPLKGDDYILYCKPEEQKTPRPERLRQWYLTMLEKSQTEGVVTRLTNLYKDGFEGPGPYNATSLAYFQGDYWPGAAEDCLKAIEDEKLGLVKPPKKKADPKKKKANTNKTKKAKASGVGAIAADAEAVLPAGEAAAVRGRRAGGAAAGDAATDDMEALEAAKKEADAAKEAADAEAKKAANLAARDADGWVGDRDEALMEKLAAILQPMAEDFIVAKMREECSECKKCIASKIWEHKKDGQIICDACHEKKYPAPPPPKFEEKDEKDEDSSKEKAEKGKGKGKGKGKADKEGKDEEKDEEKEEVKSTRRGRSRAKVKEEAKDEEMEDKEEVKSKAKQKKKATLKGKAKEDKEEKEEDDKMEDEKEDEKDEKDDNVKDDKEKDDKEKAKAPGDSKKETQDGEEEVKKDGAAAETKDGKEVKKEDEKKEDGKTKKESEEEILNSLAAKEKKVEKEVPDTYLESPEYKVIKPKLPNTVRPIAVGCV